MAIKDMYLTISEAAKELGVSRQTVYRWIDDKKFPSEKMGGVILVDKKSVLEYMAKVKDKSLIHMITNSLPEFIRREYKYAKGDIIKNVEPEDRCITFIVERADGKSEKIKIGGLDVSFSVGRNQRSSGVRDIKFIDTTKTDYERPEKIEGGKKSK